MKFFFTCCLILPLISFAQQDYDIKKIPATLLKNADRVVRYQHAEFDLNSPSKGKYNFYEVQTLLNQSAADELSFSFNSNKFKTLSSVTVRLLDAQGNEFRKYTKKNFSEVINASDLVPEGKILSLDAQVYDFPVTVITEYELDFKGIFMLPPYLMQYPKQSVERSEFVFKSNSALDFRYLEKNTDLQPAITNKGADKIYTWTATNLPARIYEESSGALENSFPIVLFAPVKFELDGYAGDMSTWKDLGRWYNSLVKDDNKLSVENQKLIVDLVKDAKDEKEKIAALYKYMQKNFRYVSIQLGIGGLKPEPANMVHKLKYGDCKGLSNYMQACLNAVNIKSYVAWIRSGSCNKSQVNIDPAFPYDHYNHQILCIPGSKDSIWLECTSSDSDAGYLGSFTSDRDALLMKEDGGVLVRTPRNEAENNSFTSTSTVTVNENGGGHAGISLAMNGDFKSRLFHRLAESTKEEQKDILVSELGFKQPEKFNFYPGLTGQNANAKLDLELDKVPEFTAGTKMFLNQRLFRFNDIVLAANQNRTQDFYFPSPFKKSDTTIYFLPEGFEPEMLPGDQEFQCKYGRFSSRITFNKNQHSLTCIATLVVSDNHIAAAGYGEVKKFFDNVQAFCNEKVVVKKT